jgi:hypothetical protein
LKLGLAVLFAAYAGLELFSIWENLRIGNIWFNDFFEIWSFAKFPLMNHAADIYDRSILAEFQRSLGGTHGRYIYPPSFLLLIIPFGLLDYYPAYELWGLGTFILYFAVSQRREWPRFANFLIVSSPATVVTLVFGQTGFLISALIVGGFRFASCRPILSGILFGLVSIKPQFGILIPIALVSARRWLTMAAASGTIVVLIFTSSVAFGWSIWPLWASGFLAHADWAGSAWPQFMPTIIKNLTFLGVDLFVARRIQLAVAVFIAGIIWLCFRHGVTNLGIAALLVGTFLATPYAFVYDMPMVTNAILAVAYNKERVRRPLQMPEAFILLWSLILPALMVAKRTTWVQQSRCIPLILLFGLIAWHHFRGRRDVAKSGSCLV